MIILSHRAELATAPKVSQAQVFEIQDALLSGDTVKIEYEHHFADGVYARVLKVPAGNFVVGAAHKTKHLSVLLRGKIVITGNDGKLTTLEAPQVFVVEPGKKKLVWVEEDLEFMNVHPTDTEDLAEIEKQVIIPEPEYRALVAAEEAKQLEGASN